MDVSAYLKRINHRGSAKPTIETLRVLHRAHLLTVPFENLDIHLGNPIVLEEGALFDKIINSRRGGYCYELNGLFAWLLRQLGYRVTMFGAATNSKYRGGGQDVDHLTLLVELGERWIADVGFGDAYRLPLRLDERGEQQGVGNTYRIDQKDGHWELWDLARGKPELSYTFSLTPHQLTDFQGANLYYQTSPESGFRRKRICSRAIADGLVSLSDDRLIITRNGQRHETPLAGEQDFVRALRRHFGIKFQGGQSLQQK